MEGLGAVKSEFSSSGPDQQSPKENFEAHNDLDVLVGKSEQGSPKTQREELPEEEGAFGVIGRWV